MRSVLRCWTNRSVIECLTIPVVCTAVLLGGCDSDREPTSPAAPPADIQAMGDVDGPQFLMEPIQTASLLDQALLANQAVSKSNPTEAAEELPGMGHKFELFFAMVDDQDPENPTNDVISVVTTPVTIGMAYRKFPPGIKISALDDQINLKYYFEAPRTCGGGNPRITLLVDADGDGDFDQDPPISPTDPDDSDDFAAQGHVNPPGFIGCMPNLWHIEDLTDERKRWETTALVTFPGIPPTVCGPIGAVTTCTWEELETRVTLAFPNHKVIAGFLHDGDACSFFAGACGKAYYDLVTLENRTLENDQDTVH